MSSSSQLAGTADISCYINFLKHFKGGCIEIDPLHHKLVKKDCINPVPDITVGHHKTFTGTILLSDILIGIRELLEMPDVITDPIIISFDNKDLIKYEEHQIVWSLLFGILGSHLYLEFNNTQFKLQDIKRKVLIKWKQCNKKKCLNYDAKSSKDCKCTQLIKPNTKILGNLINPRKITDMWTHMNDFNTKSLEANNKFTRNLRKIQDFIDKYSTKVSTQMSSGVVNLSTRKFLRKFPSKYNVSSGNYNFLIHIIYGMHMVALNIQNPDIHTMMMIEFFRDGSLRLMPSWIRNPPALINIPTIEYHIYFNKNYFSSIYVCDELEEEKLKKCLKEKDKKVKKINNDNIFIVTVTAEIEMIYVKLQFQNSPWHGGITLNRTDNCLYFLKNTGQNCKWFTNLKKGKLNIRLELESSKVSADGNTIKHLRIVPVEIVCGSNITLVTL
jgi:hypothetical protein